ncbi:MAG: hypothetical protein ABIS92_03465 [Polyangia bacterium]
MFETVQIIFSGLEGSEPVRTEVRAWLTKVAPLIGDGGITRGHVLIEATYQHHHGAGWRYQASLELATPVGVTLIATDCAGNNPSDDIYVAVRNVFRCARRALTALNEQRDLMPPPPPPGTSLAGLPPSSSTTALPRAVAVEVDGQG